MKRKYVKGTALFLAVLLAAGSCLYTNAAGSETKDENVYVNLGQDGSVDGIYVVNVWQLEETAGLTDYGNYASVKNMTTDDEITLEKGKITFWAPKGRFCYQGNLDSAELPWKIDITYLLDGKERQAGELAGQNGALEIRIHVEPNDRADEAFTQHYQLQVAVTMDMDRCSALTAAGAGVSNEGTDKKLTYQIPADTEKDICIRADVLDFAMAPIVFTGLPMSWDLDRDGLKLDDFYDEQDEIRDSAEEIYDQASGLKEGTDSLTGGAQGLKSGTETLGRGLESLRDGTGLVRDGIDSLQDGSDELAEGADGLAEGIRSLKDGMDQLYQSSRGENGAAAGAQKLAEGARQLQEGAGSLDQGVSALVGMVKGLGDTTAMDEQTALQLQLIVQGLNSAGLDYQLGDLTPGTGNVYAEAVKLDRYLDNLINQMLRLLQMMAGQSENSGQSENGGQSESGGQGNEGSQGDSQGETQDNPQSDGTASGGTVSGNNPDPESNAAAGGEGAGPENGKNQETQTGAESLKLTGSRAKTGVIMALDTGSDPVGSSAADLAGRISLLMQAKAGVDQILGGYAAMGEIDRQLSDETVTGQLEQLEQGAGELSAGVGQLADGIAGLADGLKKLTDGMGQLTDGAAQLADGGEELAGGTRELADGVSGLSEGVEEVTGAAQDLMDGASGLADGSDSLAEGIGELADSAGELTDDAEELKNRSDRLETGLDEGVDGILAGFSGEDYTPVSFVSDRNTDVGLVQFVMKTEAIRVREEKQPEALPEKLSLWQRILKLFGF